MWLSFTGKTLFKETLWTQKEYKNRSFKNLKKDSK
jgi:hypothetical protein